MMDAESRHRLAGIVLIAAATVGFAGAGVAQEIPEGQSCGGLVCDLGLFGHKTTPKPASEAPRPAAAPPDPIRAAAAPEPTKPVGRKKARVAKVNGPKVVPAKAAATSPASRPTVSAATMGAPPIAASLVPPPAAAVPAPSPVAAALEPPAAAALTPVAAAAIPVTATPARDEPVVLSNPYVYTRPLPFMFQSVDPTQGVQ